MAVTPLATVEEIKDYYQLTTDTATDDAALEDLSYGITEMFLSWCGLKSFIAADYTEYTDGSGDRFLYLNNPRVNNVSELNKDADWNFGSDTTVGSDKYRVVGETYLTLKEGVFTLGRQNYKIIYNAGFVTVPTDLKQVCIEEVIRRWEHKKDFDVVAKSNDDGSVSYSEKGLLTGTKQVLSKYANIGVI